MLKSGDDTGTGGLPRRFDPETETDFRSRFETSSARFVRRTTTAAIAVYAVSVVLDIVMFPDRMVATVATRVAAFLPAAIAALLTFNARGPHTRAVAGLLLVLSMGVPLALVGGMASRPENGVYVALLVVLFFFGGLGTALPHFSAAFVNWSLVIVFNVTHAIAGDMSFVAVAGHNAALVAASGLTLAIGIVTDRRARAEYLRNTGLETTNAELESRNRELEQAVSAQTQKATRATGALAFLSEHDSLTGLKNKRSIQSQIQMLVEASEPFAVCYVNLDRFGSINDRLGHRRADEVLRQLAHRLRDSVRDRDAVGRRAGDEFLVLVAGTPDKEDMQAIVARLLDAIRRPVSITGEFVSVTASLGIAYYPKDAADEESLLRCADAAMHSAKNNGRDRAALFSSDLGEATTKRTRIESMLRSAQERRELRMHYQPKIHLATGRVAGVEALVRWESPEGPVSPAVFVPIAEELGLMSDIGTWVLNTSIAEMLPLCREIDDGFVLAINLSATQFADSELLATIRGAIRASGISPNHLRFEIVESSLVQDVDLARRVMSSIRDLGATISLDDFGTGYSSLSYLSRFPLDEIKIDQSFVRNMTENTEDETISRSIVLLGHSLGLSVVAEGVESIQHEAALREMGCDIGQGYLYAKPTPVKELPISVMGSAAYLDR